ncbi:hypothetical protein Q1695_010330 [Nippostrongylus brasiliensis]|nr:hypothetical protein Q1695_010330 [Nippostrongylus brasiliensis]
MSTFSTAWHTSDFGRRLLGAVLPQAILMHIPRIQESPVSDESMDFVLWRSRNLARTILSQALANVLHRYNESIEDFVRRAERLPETHRQHRSQDSSTPYYRRFAHKSSRSSSANYCSEKDRSLLFRTRPTSFSEHGDRALAFLPDSPRSSSSSLAVDDPRPRHQRRSSTKRWVYNSVAYYRRFCRTSTTSEIQYGQNVQWMTSAHFTSELGRQKIVEYIEKTWTTRSRTNFIVEHIGAVTLPGIVRHKYAVLFRAGRFSAVVYFSIDVSTVYIRRPVTVTFTLPDGRPAHRLDTPRTHFDDFLRALYPYGKER